MNGLARRRQLVALFVHHQIARGDAHAGAVSAAQLYGDARQQLAVIEGLGDVIDGARVEIFDLAAHVRLGGDDHHRAARRRGGQHLFAAHIRQHQV